MGDPDCLIWLGATPWLNRPLKRLIPMFNAGDRVEVCQTPPEGDYNGLGTLSYWAPATEKWCVKAEKREFEFLVSSSDLEVQGPRYARDWCNQLGLGGNGLHQPGDDANMSSRSSSRHSIESFKSIASEFSKPKCPVTVPDVVQWREGLATKEGGKNKNSWKTRYFVLTEDANLKYSAAKNSRKKGLIPLANASKVSETQNEKKGVYGLKIQTPERVWYLRLTDKDRRDEWVKCIQQFTSRNAEECAQLAAELLKIRRRLSPGEAFLKQLRLARPHRDSPVLTRLLREIREADD